MTIRLRLTFWYTALLGTTLILFSVIVYSALASNLWVQVEQDAARQANEVASALAQQLQFDVLIIRNSPTRVQIPELDFFASASGVQLVGLDGMILKRSSNLGATTVPEFRTALEPVGRRLEHVYYADIGDDTQLLVYSVPLVTGDAVIGAVQVIKSVTAVENALRQVSRYLILGTGLSLILAAIIGAFLARRALAPIDTITETANQIAKTRDLGQRLTITEDSSEVGRLAATFNAMLDHIEQLFDTQQRLIADVSHELRTPLTTVQGNVDLLQRMAASSHQPVDAASNNAVNAAVINDETAEYGASNDEPINMVLGEVLEEVQAETSRMGTMINDLLLIAQADSGVLQIQKEPVEIDTLVLDIFRQAHRIAERQKGAGALEIRLGSEDQALVLGDRERLRQLLLNLMDNAIKYTPDGGAITIGLNKADGWVQVSVADTGIGITTENQHLVFDRFYRTDKARSRELGGSGLGLSIVQSIADAHGGYVTVESELNKGSTFSLWLPQVDEAN